jgi:poly(A) polymerase
VADPVIVPRDQHPISRRDIDPDALRVLYRLHEHRYQAYLVGGGVRDLLLGRKPKDFDVGTNAHPYEIKKTFRNCWIIGRRFRLAHVKFGQKTIEVATFRKNVPEPPQEAQTVDPAAPAMLAAEDARHEPHLVASSPAPDPASDDAGMMHRDNTFGTAEEDAFRRDFTINALFYDIATFSVIDYVGGLEDLRRRLIRCIGDPNVRFKEDPVRMLRAAVFAARLDFHLDQPILDAVEAHRELIATASPARLMEEYYKILRSGYAEATFRMLQRLGLAQLLTPELEAPPDAMWASLARLDRWRRRQPAAPPELTNAVLVGSLLVPLGVLERRAAETRGDRDDRSRDRVIFGMLPIARKDIDRLRHALMIVPRLVEPSLPPRLVRSLPGRPSFPDAITWLEIHGDAPDAVAHWQAIYRERPPQPAHRGPRHPPRQGQPQAPHASHQPQLTHHSQAPQDAGDGHHPHRRRRRRRRRGRGGSTSSGA